MKKLLNMLGSVSGGLGVAVCLVAGGMRLGGHFHLAGFETMTLFQGGVALMVAGCLFRLHALDRA